MGFLGETAPAAFSLDFLLFSPKVLNVLSLATLRMELQDAELICKDAGLLNKDAGPLCKDAMHWRKLP